jgi:hypothetical protein
MKKTLQQARQVFVDLELADGGSARRVKSDVVL